MEGSLDKFPWLHLLTWFVSPSWQKLHHVPSEGAWQRIVQDGSRRPRKAACGLRVSFVAPGVFSRMGRERCAHCCRALGIPNGKGSGLNDKNLVRYAGACFTCSGSGKVIAGIGRSKVKYKPCETCNGSGWAKKKAA